jgi:hypothetical protein
MGEEVHSTHFIPPNQDRNTTFEHDCNFTPATMLIGPSFGTALNQQLAAIHNSDDLLVGVTLRL